jgi:hypothetical protein
MHYIPSTAVNERNKERKKEKKRLKIINSYQDLINPIFIWSISPCTDFGKETEIFRLMKRSSSLHFFRDFLSKIRQK